MRGRGVILLDLWRGGTRENAATTLHLSRFTNYLDSLTREIQINKKCASERGEKRS